MRLRVIQLAMIGAFGIAIIPIAEADFRFGAPINLGATINSTQDEWPECMSADGLEFYFGSYNRLGGYGKGDLWVSTRLTREDQWGTPVNLGPMINGPTEDQVASMSADGLELYFASDRSGEAGNWDIWVSTRVTKKDPWGEPVNLGSPVNTSMFEAGIISSDGLNLFINSYDRPGGFGKFDIWVSTRATKNGIWSTPINLGPTINSSFQEIANSITTNGLTLFFGDYTGGLRPNGMGNEDIWMTTRANVLGPWGNPVNLEPQVNSSFLDGPSQISWDSRTLYFMSSRPGGIGGGDIWQVSIEPIVDLNHDSQVDAKDMSILVDHWHTSDPLCDIGPNPMGDGMVDVNDIIVLSEYLEPGYGRIAHWKLDETEGTVAYDSVGPYQADVLGDATWQPDRGNMAGALEFDGVDDCLAPALVLNPTEGSFRMLVWIKGGAPGQIIASQAPGDFSSGYAYLAADPVDGTLMTEMIFLDYPLKSEVVITDDQWHEVELEWDGDYRHLSVDGVEVAVDEIKIPLLNHTGWLDIGTGKDGQAGTYWSGLMDEIRIYKKGQVLHGLN
jgi:hypothetical protein